MHSKSRRKSGDDRKPTAGERFAIIDLDDRDKDMSRRLRFIETNPLGCVDYHKGSTLSIRCVLWGCMEVQTMVKQHSPVLSSTGAPKLA